MLSNILETTVWLTVGILRIIVKQIESLVEMTKSVKSREFPIKERRTVREISIVQKEEPIKKTLPEIQKEEIQKKKTETTTTDLLYDLIKANSPKGITLKEAAKIMNKKPQSLSRAAGYLVNASKIIKDGNIYRLP